MPTVILIDKDLKDWVHNHEVPFAHRTGDDLPEKKLTVDFNKTYRVYENKREVLMTASSSEAIDKYNSI